MASVSVNNFRTALVTGLIVTCYQTSQVKYGPMQGKLDYWRVLPQSDVEPLPPLLTINSCLTFIHAGFRNVGKRIRWTLWGNIQTV